MLATFLRTYVTFASWFKKGQKMADDGEFEADWSKAEDKTVEHILAEAQQFLAGQLTLATSADQRAASLAGVFATAAAGAAGGGFASLSSGFSSILGWSAFASAALFAVASIFCIRAILPTGFHLAGSTPQAWRDDLKGGIAHLDSLKEEVGIIAGYITFNETVLKKNAGRFKKGALFGVFAPVAGAGVAAALKLALLACAAGFFA